MDKLCFWVRDVALVFSVPPLLRLYTAIVFGCSDGTRGISAFPTEWNDQNPIPFGVDYY
jgi:hypothetical protein